MSSTALTFAFIGPLFWSLAVILYRIIMPRGADAKTLMIFTQLGASCLTALATGLPNFLVLPREVLTLLLLSGVTWGLGVYLEIRALEHLEAAAMGVIGAFRYVLTIIIGLSIFAEPFGVTRGTGALLILLSILGISDWKKASFKRGFLLQLGSTLPQTCALAIDKHLSSLVPPNAIAISSFFFCGLVFLVLSPWRALHIRGEIQKSHGLSLLIPFCLAGSYYGTVQAFALANFVPIMAIGETSLIMSWALAYFILKERDRPLRSLICCIVCGLGVFLVCQLP